MNRCIRLVFPRTYNEDQTFVHHELSQLSGIEIDTKQPGENCTGCRSCHEMRHFRKLHYITKYYSKAR